MDDKKHRIFDAAHVLFLERGFKKTNVADITNIAGVAVGSFYLYFKSKEDIFLKIYASENESIKKQIMNKVDLQDDPRDVIRIIIDQIIKLTKNNRILKEWATNKELKKILGKQQTFQKSLIYLVLMPIIDQWIKDGKIKDGIDRLRILNLFEVLLVVDEHKKEVQAEDYQQLLTDLTNGILLFIKKN